MKTPLIAALLLGSASLAGVGLAQTPDATEPMTAPAAANTADARTLASDQEVGEARRAYRAACVRHESSGFCDCVTAGVAQVLMPAEVRIAARTIGERINAQGDAPLAGESDQAPTGSSSQERIEHTEGYYANACAQFRR